MWHLPCCLNFRCPHSKPYGKQNLVAVVLLYALFILTSCHDDTYKSDHSDRLGDYFVANSSEALLYSQDFSEDDFSNWTNPQAWTVTETGAMLAEGETSYLRNFYSLDYRICRIAFSPSANSKFSVGIHNEDLVYGSNFWEVVVDAGEQTVSYGTDTRSFMLSPNHSYLLELASFGNNVTLTITDMVRGKLQLRFDKLFSESQDFYGIRNISGNSAVFKKIGVVTKNNPFVLFYGNSITHGVGTTATDGLLMNSFANLVGKEIGKPYMVSGRGGSTIKELLGDSTFKGRIETELLQLKPQFAVVTIGTNEGNTFENLCELVDKIREAGTIPILNNIPCESVSVDGVWYDYDMTRNDLIDAVRKEKNINGAKFHVATSENGDGFSLKKEIYWTDDLPDGCQVRVHPNDEGHMELAKRLKLDCPELFQ